MSTVLSSFASGATAPAASGRSRVGLAALLFGGLYILALAAAELTAVPRVVRVAASTSCRSPTARFSSCAKWKR